jgi:Toprim domain
MRRALPQSAATLSALLAALIDQAEIVATTLLGPSTSSNARESRWGSRGSLCVSTSGQARGLWFDHERGVGGSLFDLIADVRGVSLGEAIRIAKKEFLDTALPPPRPKVVRLKDDDVERRIKTALGIWDQSVPLPGSRGERYFKEYRGIDIERLGDLSDVLRWNGNIRAVVGLMTNPVTAEPCGVHRTFLAKDDSKLSRKMLGRQGIIRLSPDDEVTLGLGIVEGIEDGLAVLLSGWAPVWVATSAGAIAGFPTFAGVEALTIFADGDSPGMRAANACGARWRNAGREANVLPPLPRG